MTRLPRGFASALFLGIVLGISGPDHTLAQNPPAGGLLADGNAVVSGFSGAQLPTVIAPGVDPAEKTFIDLNGASVRVVDIQSPGAPPQGQLIATTKPFTAAAGQVGQVFAVALDDATPPNVYVAATSVYGLPIVVPPAGDGEPARAQQGGPNAQFMAGLFGPRAQQGGPGSIWRIDGASGAVSLFANVALDGVANAGPALGGLAFDPTSKNLFVADRETGIIHRFDMMGAERGRYDHGIQGRQAAGLPPMPFDQGTRLNITSPQFQPANPQTWGFAPPARRIFGLAVHDGRLYYAVADSLQIWSVGIAPDGVGADARIEITVPPGQGVSEIAKITFDDHGRMLLAERAAPSGALDFGALTEQGGRALHYTMGPPSPTGPGWTSDEYAVGFAGPMRNGNGGVAVGYGYSPNGSLDRNACGGFVWMTGEQLRIAAGSTLATQLAQGGPPNVDGLQGNAIDAVRPANAPPTQSYFVDFDDRFDDTAARGHMGDVAILRQCAAAPPGPGPVGPSPGPTPGPEPKGPPPGPPPAPGPEGPPPEQLFGPGPGELGGMPFGPPPICPVGTHLVNNGIMCCPAGQIPGNDGHCRGHCAVAGASAGSNIACESGFKYNAGATIWNPTGFPGAWGSGNPGPGAACWNNSAPVAVTDALCPAAFAGSYRCTKCPKPPLAQCQTGFTFTSAAALTAAGIPQTQWEWSDGTCRPAVPAPFCGAGVIGNDGACHNDICPANQHAYPVRECCLNGTQPDVHGHCAPGIFVPPQYYLDYLATGTGECAIPGTPCSFFEFTIIGRQRYGRGSLTQHITLPPGSDFPEARITRGSKSCPASAWSCSKSGDGFTCSAQDCGLEPGDQVVLRLEGSVAPGLTQPPPQPIAKTACGLLEWQARAGPGPAEIVAPSDARLTPRRVQTPQGVVTRYGAPSSTQVCFTTWLVAKQVVAPPPSPPPCFRGYTKMPNGECCLTSQLAASGQCCPAGMRPDAARRTCVPVTPPCDSAQRLANGQCCPLGTWPNNRQMTCEPTTPPPPTCERSQMTVTGECCPAGTRPDAARRTCVPVTPPCDSAQRLANGQCCPAGTWPNNRSMTCVPITPPPSPCPVGQHLVGRTCVPNRVITLCPPGEHRVGRTCVPDRVITLCPPGQHRVGRACVPDRVMTLCPPGQHRVGRTCVRSGAEYNRTRPRPQTEQHVRPLRGHPVGPGLQ